MLFPGYMQGWQQGRQLFPVTSEPPFYEHPLDSLSDFFVRKAFAPVELFQALLDVLAKPCIVVEIMLDKLLNVTVGIAAVFGGDSTRFSFVCKSELKCTSMEFESRDCRDSCQ